MDPNATKPFVRCTSTAQIASGGGNTAASGSQRQTWQTLRQTCASCLICVESVEERATLRPNASFDFNHTIKVPIFWSTNERAVDLAQPLSRAFAAHLRATAS